ncbi:hypothetical protein SNEBB_000833 [Seison nebaliae]|nr:hypothetical protein SNEBB_000833 [Seison nebaliae]
MFSRLLLRSGARQPNIHCFLSTFHVKQNVMYTKSHEWLKEMDAPGHYRIGLTHHAQRGLGDIVYTELLIKATEKIDEGTPISVIESVKAAEDLLSPVGGIITAVNEQLEDNPSLINKSAEEEGWIVEIESKDLDKLNFLTKKEYENYLVGTKEENE